LAQAPRPAPAQPNAAARAATPAPAPRAPTNTSRPTAAANQTDHAGRANHADHGARTHTVRAGESLWSIASDVLGPAAPPWQIAREVHRLWELNKERIATGDPDLLLIDTRLRLR
jgi:nucleoid-associated protein YgaU